MSRWSKYEAWRNKHEKEAELIKLFVEFFVAVGVVIELSKIGSRFLSRFDFSFLSYRINFKIQVGVIILIALLLFISYFIIGIRLKRLRQKLAQSVNEIKSESNIAQTEIHVEVSTEINFSTNSNLSYPLKLYFHIINTNDKSIIIDKLIFEALNGIKVHPNNKIKIGENIYKPNLFLGMINGQENWSLQAVIQPYKEVKFFIPIDNEFGKSALENSLKNGKVGTVLMRATLLDTQIVSDNLKFNF